MLSAARSGSLLLAIALVLVVNDAAAQAVGPPVEAPPLAAPPTTDPPPVTPDPAPDPAPTPAPDPAPVPTPAPALDTPAAQPARFGDRGQFVLTAAAALDISSTEYSESDAKFFYASISPGLDYFVVRGVSIGAELIGAYRSSKGYTGSSDLVETTSTSFAGGPRLGIAVPLGELVSFYPRATFGIEVVEWNERLLRGRITPNPSGRVPVLPPSASVSSKQLGPYVSLFAPLLFHPQPHFFIGAGPGIFHEFSEPEGDVATGGRRTSIFGQVVVGGWWGKAGTERVAAPVTTTPAIGPAKSAPRFGDAGHLVITGAVGASVSFTTDGADTERTTASFSPGFDYFVAPQLSVGLAGGISAGNSTARLADGSKYERKATGFGLALRIGLNFNLSPLLSFYPRAWLAGSEESIDITIGTAPRFERSETVATVGITAPLLFHLAPHFFTGFGPFARHDVKRDGAPGPENLETAVGADLTVGGWL